MDEARELLRRIVKYAREDRATTPRATRLERVLAETERFLARASEPEQACKHEDVDPMFAACNECGAHPVPWRRDEPEQCSHNPAARERLADVATTIYRKLGCVCQWEAGDSPCPVHDRFCADDLAETRSARTGVRPGGRRR